MLNLQLFSIEFLSLFIEAVPFLLIGTLLSGFIEVFVDPAFILRFAPRRVFFAALAGVFVGFLFPVCECGVVPVVRKLLRKGMPIPMGITILLAAPVMNPITFMSTYTAFGFGPVMHGRYIVTALVAMIAGLTVAQWEGTRILLPEPHQRTTVDRKLRLDEKIMESLTHSAQEFFEMGFYFVLGCLLATAMRHVFPQSVLLSLGSGSVLSVVIMQLVAYVLSVCSTADAFIALGFVGTFSTGSIVTFLTFGAMVDTKSTLMFLSTFKKRTVLFLLLIPATVTFLSGVLINLLH